MLLSLQQPNEYFAESIVILTLVYQQKNLLRKKWFSRSAKIKTTWISGRILLQS